jgi:hypothetical protein
VSDEDENLDLGKLKEGRPSFSRIEKEKEGIS